MSRLLHFTGVEFCTAIVSGISLLSVTSFEALYTHANFEYCMKFLGWIWTLARLDHTEETGAIQLQLDVAKIMVASIASCVTFLFY